MSILNINEKNIKAIPEKRIENFIDIINKIEIKEFD